jgi:hypothetical protein
VKIDFNRFFFLALFVSNGSILVLGHGLLRTGPLLTGLFFLLSTVAIFSLSRRDHFLLGSSDILFVIFLCCIAISFVNNGVISDWKEPVLLTLSLAAYPACRFFASDETRMPFIWTTAALVFIGTIVTLVFLVSQWSDPHGKPMIFGRFDAAPLQFLISLGFLLIALVCSGLSVKKVGIISAAIFVPASIFAASMVRFGFVAIAGSLTLAGIVALPKERKYISVLILVLFVAVGTGVFTRSATNMKFISYEMAVATDSQTSEQDNSCRNLDLDDSIEIRKQLFKEAFDLLPKAGMFGIGLDGFSRVECIERAEVHNSILQIFIEFGWLGGTMFVLLIVVAGAPLLPLARYDLEARFVLCSLSCVLLLSMVYGRVSRDALVFLFTGYAASLHERRLSKTLAQDGDS